MRKENKTLIVSEDGLFSPSERFRGECRVLEGVFLRKMKKQQNISTLPKVISIIKAKCFMGFLNQVLSGVDTVSLDGLPSLMLVQAPVCVVANFIRHFFP